MTFNRQKYHNAVTQVQLLLPASPSVTAKLRQFDKTIKLIGRILTRCVNALDAGHDSFICDVTSFIVKSQSNGRLRRLMWKIDNYKNFFFINVTFVKLSEHLWYNRDVTSIGCAIKKKYIYIMWVERYINWFPFYVSFTLQILPIKILSLKSIRRN